MNLENVQWYLRKRPLEYCSQPEAADISVTGSITESLIPNARPMLSRLLTFNQTQEWNVPFETAKENISNL